jgi:hypothetical protein
MTSYRARLAVVATALVVTACTTPSTDTGGASSQLPQSSVTVTAIPEATATPVPSPSAIANGPQPTPPNVDPCSLLTTAEASAIIGMSLSAGVVTQLDPDVACTWKSGLSEVKLILAPPAPDAATAQAYWDAEKTQVPAGIQLTELTQFDRSAYVNGSSAGVAVSALFVIQDNWFFDLYCGFPACSQAASLGGAAHIVGRLPAP